MPVYLIELGEKRKYPRVRIDSQNQYSKDDFEEITKLSKKIRRERNVPMLQSGRVAFIPLHVSEGYVIAEDKETNRSQGQGCFIFSIQGGNQAVELRQREIFYGLLVKE